ncbi:hypothetical protein N2152v2_002460 [Parachlorella kessleri]
MTAEGYPSGDGGELEGSGRGGEGRHVSYMLDIEEHNEGSVGEFHSELGDTGVTHGPPSEELQPLGQPLEGGAAARHGGAAASARKQKAQAIKSAVAVRKWVVMDDRGESQLLPMGKLAITQQMGVQLRDLRLLDPQLATSYPSAILCRERALVVNLEYIKMIITIDRAYVAVTDDDNVSTFVETLQRKLRAHADSVNSARSLDNLAGMGGGAGGKMTSGPASKSLVDLTTAAGVTAGGGGIAEDMPFELRVLEVALDSVCSYLKRMAGDLESAAHPALDSLTGHVSTSNLERVRRIKNRMVRLTTRVETLREVLEKFLDDDSDMMDMNLTALEAERQQDAARAQLLSMQRAAMSGRDTPMDVPLTVGFEASGLQTPTSPKSLISSSSSSDSEEEEEAIEQVEMLLEAYFMQASGIGMKESMGTEPGAGGGRTPSPRRWHKLDSTWNQLQTLCEYVDDTEDFINIELDSHRNQLIRLDLVLTAFSAAVGLVTAVTGLFAMNVELKPDLDGPGPYSMFVALSVSAGVGAVAVFGGILAYCRWKRLI